MPWQILDNFHQHCKLISTQHIITAPSHLAFLQEKGYKDIYLPLTNNQNFLFHVSHFEDKTDFINSASRIKNSSCHVICSVYSASGSSLGRTMHTSNRIWNEMLTNDVPILHYILWKSIFQDPRKVMHPWFFSPLLFSLAFAVNINLLVKLHAFLQSSVTTHSHTHKNGSDLTSSESKWQIKILFFLETGQNHGHIFSSSKQFVDRWKRWTKWFNLSVSCFSFQC